MTEGQRRCSSPALHMAHTVIVNQSSSWKCPGVGLADLPGNAKAREHATEAERALADIKRIHPDNPNRHLRKREDAAPLLAKARTHALLALVAALVAVSDD
jgi:hypothetical protein